LHVNHRAITQALAGAESYDLLWEPEQAIVRQAWAERATALRRALNYEAVFIQAGESYSDLVASGRLVVHPPRG
jgi:hypothetical protein